jgi:plastocyanin
MDRGTARNTVTVGLLLVTLAALPGCGDARDDTGASQPQQTAAERATVDIAASGYEPAKTKILVGGTVTWINQDAKNGHTAQTSRASEPVDPRFESSEFDTHTLTWNEPYSVTFHQPGRFKYYCSFHEMDGEVEVVRRTPPSQQ